jgi:hypothetical protein
VVKFVMSWRNSRAEQSTPGWLRRKGVAVWAAGGGLLAVLSLALLWWLLANGSARSAELTETQWRRLSREFAQVVARARAEQSAAEAVVDATASAGAEVSAATGGRTPALPHPARLPLVQEPEHLVRQWDDYLSERAKSIIELQPYRQSSTVEVSRDEDEHGTATLVNLNPEINTWYLLRLDWDGGEVLEYHLANNSPALETLQLDAEFHNGIVIADSLGSTPCDLWSASSERSLAAAAEIDAPYAMLCDGAVTLRMRTAGRKTRIEKVTDFLRDNVWGGESVTVFVRETFFQDAFLTSGEVSRTNVSGAGVAIEQDPSAPWPAQVKQEIEGSLLTPVDLGLLLEEDTGGRLAVGRWYANRGLRGVFTSVVRPDLLPADILQSHTDIVIRLDEVEMEALAYMVAFDLDEFDVAFALGTDHPRVGWSERVPEERRNPALPGPDGFDTISPMVSTGIIPPALAPRAVATFTGGFKRSHGAFLYGELSAVNNGSHYGFVEHGVIFSKLQPGLSTIYVLDDGTLNMKTWSKEDDLLLPRVSFARQNGVPIIERGRDGGAGVPGAFVSRYGAGNWSGSQEGRYRTLRAGACLQETESKRFLIYGYFSSATPSAMARVFQGYGCSYAMLLDMNALEHTYLAVYWLRDGSFSVQHLIEGMSVLDRSDERGLLPRFLGYADNRDFFYLLRRLPRDADSVELGF